MNERFDKTPCCLTCFVIGFFAFASMGLYALSWYVSGEMHTVVVSLAVLCFPGTPILIVVLVPIYAMIAELFSRITNWPYWSPLEVHRFRGEYMSSWASRHGLEPHYDRWMLFEWPYFMESQKNGRDVQIQFDYHYKMEYSTIAYDVRLSSDVDVPSMVLPWHYFRGIAASRNTTWMPSAGPGTSMSRSMEWIDYDEIGLEGPGIGSDQLLVSDLDEAREYFEQEALRHAIQSLVDAFADAEGQGPLYGDDEIGACMTRMSILPEEEHPYWQSSGSEDGYILEIQCELRGYHLMMDEDRYDDYLNMLVEHGSTIEQTLVDDEDASSNEAAEEPDSTFQ